MIGLFTGLHPGITGSGGVGIRSYIDDEFTGMGLRGVRFCEYGSIDNVLVAGIQESFYFKEYKGASTRGKDRGRRKLLPYAYSRLALAAGLGVGLRIEFNPGELIDF